MSVIFHNWEVLKEQKNPTEIKHCKMCGKNSTFTDTNIRRHNSNGKYVYRFAIYKCEKNHTWNKKLDIYKAHRKHEKVHGKEFLNEESNMLEIPINLYVEEGISEIQIIIKKISGTHRIDALLSSKILEWSRTTISEKIREGFILVNEKTVKPSAKLLQNDKIIIILKSSEST